MEISVEVPQESLKIEPYDSAEPFLCIGWEESPGQCANDIVAQGHASFTAAKIRPLGCRAAGEWIKSFGKYAQWISPARMHRILFSCKEWNAISRGLMEQEIC